MRDRLARTRGAGQGSKTRPRDAGPQFGGGFVCDHPALRDDDNAGADGIDFFENMRRENDGFILRHALDERAHLVLLIGVEPVRRFVEDERRRIVQQRLREADALFVAFRERFNDLLAHGHQLRARNRQIDLSAPGGRGAEAADFGDEAEVFLDRHLGVHRRIFRHIAKLAFYRHRIHRHVNPADRGRTFVGI